jgi:hypothetical protein
MSPKRDSLVDSSKNPTPKRDPIIDDDISAPIPAEPVTTALLGVPPLPYSRRELFKVAYETLDSEKMKDDSMLPTIPSRPSKKDHDHDDLPGTIIGKYTNITTHLISISGSNEFSFPVPVRKLIDAKTDDFVKYDDFNSCIADVADAELVSRSFKAIFIHPETHFGSKLRIGIVMGNDESRSSEEFLLNENNFADLIVSAYALYGKLTFKLYARCNFIKNAVSDHVVGRGPSPRIMKNEGSMYHSRSQGIIMPELDENVVSTKKNNKKIHMRWTMMNSSELTMWYVLKLRSMIFLQEDHK